MKHEAKQLHVSNNLATLHSAAERRHASGSDSSTITGSGIEQGTKA